MGFAIYAKQTVLTQIKSHSSSANTYCSPVRGSALPTSPEPAYLTAVAVPTAGFSVRGTGFSYSPSDRALN